MILYNNKGARQLFYIPNDCNSGNRNQVATLKPITTICRNPAQPIEAKDFFILVFSSIKMQLCSIFFRKQYLLLQRSESD